MPNYRRIPTDGAPIFLTVKTHQRRPIFVGTEVIDLLRQACRHEGLRRPFTTHAAVILPDHLHLIWTLPQGDDRVGLRISKIKTRFTHLYLGAEGAEGVRTASRRTRCERGIWQRRFWDHVIRNEDEYGAYVDYVHYNPVKHAWARCPHQWVASSFREHVQRGHYPIDWLCDCGPRARPPDFSRVTPFAGE